MAIKSSEQYLESMVHNLKPRTGKSLAEWVRVAQRGPGDIKQLRAWLKSEHGLGMNTCWLIADAALGPKADDEQLLESQFRGGRAALRPVYDRLIREARKLGRDVEVGVRKTQTTLARKHTFAVVKAPTLKKMDLGLRLPGARGTRRLQATTAFSGNATHAVVLSKVADVDARLIDWLRAAYEERA